MKKVIAVLVAAVLVLTVFAACGKNGTEENTTAEVVDNPGDVDVSGELTSDFAGKELVMGTNAAFPPYEFVGDDGEYAGIDVEIANAIAEKLGMTLTVKDMEFNSLIDAVAAGSIDVVLAGLTVNPERAERVNFSTSYATGVQVVIVKEDSDIATVDDLAGKMIGVQSGTTGDIYCTDEYTQDNVKQFNTGADAVLALKNGQVDCVVIDNEPAKNFVAANEGLKILETEYAVEDYAAAFSKENTELLEAFDAALKMLQADGTVDSIIAKYIKAE